jgi:glucans biosynthesis protein
MQITQSLAGFASARANPLDRRACIRQTRGGRSRRTGGGSKRLLPRPPQKAVDNPLSTSSRRARRASLAASALAAVLALLPGRVHAFEFSDVVARARALAAAPYANPENDVPQWLREIDYDQWRDIRFRPDRALWPGGRTRFRIQFFHPGFLYERTIRVNEIDSEGVRPIALSPSDFDYGKNEFGSRVPQELRPVGLRVHYPILKPDRLDEFLVFLGATYLRAVGRDLHYGLSARGLAIDTASPRGEEFPGFVEFWLLRPAPEASELEIYALLDSRRVAGAYHFTARPGEHTRIDIDSYLFLREPIEKLGIGPLTSMFLRGENTRRWFDDFRPEIHDSDGLQIQFSSGEWLFRPIDNPEELRVSSFDAADVRGFGLVQRDRNFDHYQDLETHPEMRPSAWITPRGSWGPGRVELVEIPVQKEFNDNVVAFWVPTQSMGAGGEVRFEYTLDWYGEDASRPPGAYAEATRVDRGTHDGALRLVIDFAGKILHSIPEEAVVEGVVSIAADRGELLEQRVERNPVTRGYRLVFQLRPRGGGPLELRAFLRHKARVLTETWSYVLKP